jgi:hypothetical protein
MTNRQYGPSSLNSRSRGHGGKDDHLSGQRKVKTYNPRKRSRKHARHNGFAALLAMLVYMVTGHRS